MGILFPLICFIGGFLLCMVIVLTIVVTGLVEDLRKLHNIVIPPPPSDFDLGTLRGVINKDGVYDIYLRRDDN